MYNFDSNSLKKVPQKSAILRCNNPQTHSNIMEGLKSPHNGFSWKIHNQTV